MAEPPQKSSHTLRKPELGAPFDARFQTDVMVGPRQLTPNNPATESDGWRLAVDDGAVYVSHVNHPTTWTRVPWENVRYVRYRSKAVGEWQA